MKRKLRDIGILLVILFVIIASYCVSGYTFAKSGKDFEYNISNWEWGKPCIFTPPWMVATEFTYHIMDIVCIDGPSLPIYTRGDNKIKLTKPGTYVLRIHACNAANDVKGGDYYKTTIHLSWKYEFKKDTLYTAPVIIKNGIAKKKIDLREYLRDATGDYRIEEISSGLTVESKELNCVEVSARKAGTYKLRIRNTRSASKYCGSYTEWYIYVKKPSSSSNSKSSSKSSSNSSNNSNKGSNTPSYSNSAPTPKYKPYIKIGSVSYSNEYAKNKDVTFSVSTTDMNSTNISVKGKSSGNIGVKQSGGKYIFTAKKNDTYTITAKGKGKDGKNYTKTSTVAISKIDNKKPTCSNFTIKRTKGNNKVKLNLTVKDESALESVDILKPDGSKLTTINVSKMLDACTKTTITTKEVNTPGKYKVIIKDKAGNSYTYKTAKVEIDDKAPVIKSFSITKESSKTGHVSTEDKGVEKILATTGDVITLKIWTSEYLSANPEVYIQSETIGKVSAKMKRATAKSKNGWYLTTVTFRMSSALKESEYVPILIKGLKDKWGNVNSNSKTYDKKLYYDVSSPIIKQLKISASSSEGNEISGLCKQLTENTTVKIEFITHEILTSTPTVTMSGVTKNIKTTNYKKVELGYLYSTSFKLNSKQLENVPKGIQEIAIKNLVDRSGNVTKEKLYKFDSNKNYVLYGDIITGGLYIDLVNSEENLFKPIGDVNENGYITSYDYLLLDKYLKEEIYSTGKTEETYSNNFNKYDINKDGKINKSDLEELEKTLRSSVNNIDVKGLNIKIYDINNNLVKGEELNKLQWLSSRVNQEIVNAEEGIINIKIQDTKGKMPGLVTYNNSLGNIRLNVVEEIKHEKSGFVTVQKSGLSYKRQLYDINKDGAITEFDAIIIQKYVIHELDNDESKEIKAYIEEKGDVNRDGEVNIADTTYLQKEIAYKEKLLYNNIIKDDEIILKYIERTENSTNEDIDKDKISWSSLDENIATVQKNENGTATVKAVGNPGEQTQIIANYQLSGDADTKYSIYNLKISDLGINMVKTTSQGEEQEEDVTEIQLSKEYEETAKLELNVEDIESENSDVTWEIENEEIASITKDDENKLTIVPLKAGQTKITAKTTLKGVEYTAETNLNIDNRIQEVAIIHNGEPLSGVLQLIPTQEYEFTVETNPKDITESYEVSVEDNSVLSIAETDNGYVVTALEEGETNIIVETEKGKAVFPVKVNVNSNPVIKNIYAENNTKNYKAGDIIELKVEFDQNIKGDVPDIKLYFNDDECTGEYEGNIVDNKIIYKYKVGEEDNGQLYVGDIVLSEGQTLTDLTGISNADLSKDTLNLIKDDNENEEKDENTGNNEENQDNDDNLEIEEKDDEEGQELDYEEDKYLVEGIYILQKKPTLTSSIVTSNESNSVKDGDSVYLYMEASTELKENPKVIMGGKSAVVTNDNLNYKAELKVTKDIVKEGLLQVKIEQFEDKYGNVGEPIELNTDENAEDAIIVDYTAPDIDNIVCENYTSNSKAGDKIQIKVTFSDETKGTTELIQVPEKEENGSIVYEFPKLEILFGGKEAKGEITANYLKEESDSTEKNNINNSNTIVYTYTMTNDDKGDISLKSLKGIVYDMAKNKNELNYNSEINKYVSKDQDDTGKDNENNNKDNNKGNNNEKDETKNQEDNIASKKLPYTGIAMNLGLFGIIALIVGFIIKRRRGI